MSDYLTNVISRSLGVEPKIQPRVASLFEPARMDLPVFEHEVEREREVHDESVPQVDFRQRTGIVLPGPPLRERVSELQEKHVTLTKSDAPVSNEDSRVAPPSLPRQQEIETQSSPASQEERTISVPQTRVEVVEAPAKPLESISPESQPSIISPVARIDQFERPVKNKIEKSQPEREEKRIEPSQPPSPLTRQLPVPVATPTAPIAVQQAPSSSPAPHIVKEKSDVTVKTEKSVVTRVERESTNTITHVLTNRTTAVPLTVSNVVQPISVIPAPRVETDDAVKQVTIEPTIHVSIGRVEIRNIVDKVSGKKSQKQSRLMSLDDYLRQRAQGAKQ